MTVLRAQAVRRGRVARLPATRRGWCLPTAIRRFASRLFSQQLWCWGQDVKHSGGNLLLRYGMERFRKPGDPRGGATCYRSDENDRHAALWGFGMFFGTRRLGGLYLARYDFVPQWGEFESLRIGIHSPDDLPPFHRPHRTSHWRAAHELLHETIRWIIRYENWVIQEVGAPYRHDCVTRWIDPVVSGERMASAWRLLNRRRWEQHNWTNVQSELLDGRRHA